MRPGVSERDIRHLSVGQEVPVRLDADPNVEWTGTIRRIFPAADANSRLIHVEVLLPPESYEQGVRPGFLARLPLLVDPRPDAVAVPAAAVGEDGDERYIYVVRDERLHKQIITTGVTRGQWTQVEEGIAVGDIVLATNPIDMRDGTRVRIVNWRG
ncbi:MAG: efflux RND transporter periplasmic adaptor subunit [Idiomarina sp.]|nr:efflux RND transporter periplasmic adaptor subunit [Idiomarina sp.]